ncbi:MAG: serine hydrolase [Pseudomonadales bacterium]|nr:serine hydrolase [Pseudomonadales bacterium]
MIDRLPRAVLALTLVFAAVLSQAQTGGFDPARLTRLIETGMAQWHVPGLAVMVIEGGELVYQRGFGTTAIADGKPVDVHTLFANASTTKAMVVAGILMLADEGRLSLDDPASRHLPELHFHPLIENSQITIRDLLAHRTGLPSTDFWTFSLQMPLAEQIRRLPLVVPEAAPRTRLIYQNTMYELAGLIIERVSGKPWERFLRERLWRPLGMRETYGARADIPGRKVHVVPHDYLRGELRELPYDLPAQMADAAGSVWSSIHDMTLWAGFLLHGGVNDKGQRLISEQGMHEMFEPHQLATPGDFYPTVELTRPHWRTYGLGWFQQDFQGRRIEFHTGSLDGLIAIMGLDRAADRAVVVMGNRDHAELRHAILWEVMDESAPAQRRDWGSEVFDLYQRIDEVAEANWQTHEDARLADTRPSLPLTAYAGSYSNPVLGTLRVVLTEVTAENRGDTPQMPQLILQVGDRNYPLAHWHLDTFQVTYEFWRHGDFAGFMIDTNAEVSAVEVFGERFARERP